MLRPDRMTLPALLLAGLMTLSGCSGGKREEEARARLREAEAAYTALVERGVHPRSPAFDDVIARFEAVPTGTKARAEADERLAALRTLRSALPPRPLAVPGATGPGTDAVDAQRAKCEALAKKLGATPPEQREPVRRELTRCQNELTRLHAHTHAEPEPPMPHAGEADLPAPPEPSRVPDAGR